MHKGQRVCFHSLMQGKSIIPVQPQTIPNYGVPPHLLMIKIINGETVSARKIHQVLKNTRLTCLRNALCKPLYSVVCDTTSWKNVKSFCKGSECSAVVELAKYHYKTCNDFCHDQYPSYECVNAWQTSEKSQCATVDKGK